MEGFFEIHPSGKAVQVRNPTRVRDFSVQVLNAYNVIDQCRSVDACYLFSRPILVMPVHVSPIYALLRYDTKLQWTERWVDSFESLSVLRTVLQCYSSNPEMDFYKANEERIVAARSHYEKVIMELEEQLHAALAPIHRGSGNERSKLEAFLALMSQFTMQCINALERCIMAIFAVDAPLTPADLLPDVSCWSEKRRSALPMFCAKFFETKQVICNTRLEKSCAEGTFVQRRWFNSEEIAMRFDTTPADEMYKGFIDRTTAWEYFNFLDFEEGLK